MPSIVIWRTFAVILPTWESKALRSILWIVTISIWQHSIIGLPKCVLNINWFSICMERINRPAWIVLIRMCWTLKGLMAWNRWNGVRLRSIRWSMTYCCLSPVRFPVRWITPKARCVMLRKVTIILVTRNLWARELAVANLLCMWYSSLLSICCAMRQATICANWNRPNLLPIFRPYGMKVSCLMAKWESTS